MKNLLTFSILFTLILSICGQGFPDDFCLCEKQIIKSEILNKERILFVYLPNHYYSDTAKNYPVHYIADAPLSSNLYADILKLHGVLNYVPQSIVIGLSSEDREYNLNPDKGAENYLNHIATEIIPFVDENYRTEDFKVLSGHSLSGTFAIFTLLKQPDLFDAYVAGSPGPIEPIIKLAEEVESINTKKDYKFLYASIGSKDFTSSQNFDYLRGVLSKKATDQFDMYFNINEGENHISNMTINFQNGITQLYSDWQFELPDVLEKSASETVKVHFDKLESKYGYRPEVGEWEVIYPSMDKLARKGDFKNAIDILLYCTQLYPDSDQAHVFLAKAYFDTGDFEKGKNHLDKSLELNPKNEFALHMKMRIEKQ